MIHEILLYDDCSTIDELNAPLERHIAAYPKIRIVRAKERGGLVKARLFASRFVQYWDTLFHFGSLDALS